MSFSVTVSSGYMTTSGVVGLCGSFIPSFFKQSELSQKEESQYHILMHIYGIQKDGTDEPICRAAWRYRYGEHIHGPSGGRRRRGRLRE